MDAIRAARHEHRFGPHRLAPIVGVLHSTIGDVLARGALAPGDQDRPTGIPIRYVREGLGELLDIDVKMVERIQRRRTPGARSGHRDPALPPRL